MNKLEQELNEAREALRYHEHKAEVAQAYIHGIEAAKAFYEAFEDVEGENTTHDGNYKGDFNSSDSRPFSMCT